MVAADLTDDWDPRDPEVLEDQLRAYDRRRTGCPVAHSDYLGWSIFRHEDVVAIAEDATTYSSAVSVAHPAVPNGYDPPQHDTYRQIVDHYFSPEQMARFEPLCRVVAMELIETLPRNEEVEFISHFALTYALRAQRAWLGWPHYTEAALRDWTAKNHRATLARDREAMVCRFVTTRSCRSCATGRLASWERYRQVSESSSTISPGIQICKTGCVGRRRSFRRRSMKSCAYTPRCWPTAE